jgi:3',5'-cyclic-AMP phosphodiesterase
MPETLFESMNRRTFLRTSLAAAGTLVAMRAANSLGSETDDKQVLRLAFLSDTHIPADVNNHYRGFYPYRNLQKVVPQVVSASPDGVVITGDLARLTGESGDYANFKKLLNPLAEKTPIYLALGNHDNRKNFLKAFNKTAGQQQSVPDKYVTVVHKAPVRLILLDSLLYTNKVPGLLGKAQRQWLEKYLAESDNTPTILCFHHTLGDGDSDLLDAPRLFRVVEPIQKVKAIIYGHSHVYAYSQHEGIHLINLPAVGYNFSDKEPVGWVQARLRSQGGDFTLHAVGGNRDADGRTTKLTWR